MNNKIRTKSLIQEGMNPGDVLRMLSVRHYGTDGSSYVEFKGNRPGKRLKKKETVVTSRQNKNIDIDVQCKKETGTDVWTAVCPKPPTVAKGDKASEALRKLANKLEKRGL